MKQTHTFVTLPVSQAAFDEIKQKLLDASYHHLLREKGVVEMQGIALVVEEPEKNKSSTAVIDKALKLVGTQTDCQCQGENCNSCQLRRLLTTFKPVLEDLAEKAWRYEELSK